MIGRDNGEIARVRESIGTGREGDDVIDLDKIDDMIIQMLMVR